MKNALITGVTGQDGSYLSELLLDKGYNVFGLMRRKSELSYGNSAHLRDKVTFIDGDMTDQSSLIKAMKISKADEVYNLAAQSFVATSWNQPTLTADVDAIGVSNMLEAIRFTNPEAHFYQASTSEMFGLVQDYVKAMWLMLQQDKPDDYVIATGETHTVREFVTLAFLCAGIELEWQGEGINEKAFDKKNGILRVEVNPKFFRPAEVELLLGDPTKAEKVLGWKRTVSFNDLITRMVEADLKRDF